MSKGLDIESQNLRLRTNNHIIADLIKLQILVIGDSQTGKTQLTTALTQLEYTLWQKQQIECPHLEFKGSDKTKGCEIRVGIRNYDSLYKLNFCDFGGDKNQRSYIDLYMSQFASQIDAIMFCFDVTNLKTLDNLTRWIKNLQQKRIIEQDQVGDQDSSSQERSNSITIQDEQENLIKYQEYQGIPNEQLTKIPIYLIGCKMDLIPREKHEYIRKKIIKQVYQLFECKEGENVFLLSTARIQDHFDQFNKFELTLKRMTINNVMPNFYIKLTSLNLLDLELDDGFWNNYIRGPFLRNIQLIGVYCKHCFKKLTCRKIKG